MNKSISLALAFLIGLGFGQFLSWLAAELGRLYWLDALMGATKLGIIGYVVYLGLKQIRQAYIEWEKLRDASGADAVEVKFNGIAQAYAALAYLLVAFLLVKLMF